APREGLPRRPVQRTVTAEPVHERHRAARFARSRELEHVQEEQTLLRVRETRALRPVRVGLPQLEVGDEGGDGGHGAWAFESSEGSRAQASKPCAIFDAGCE